MLHNPDMFSALVFANSETVEPALAAEPEGTTARRADAYFHDGLIELALAVIYQAALDAKSKDVYRSLPARGWLAETGAHWLDCLGLDGKKICQAILDGKARRRMRRCMRLR